MEDDGFERIDFSNARLSLSRRTTKAGMPYRATLSYKSQVGVGDDGSPVTKWRQKSKTFPASTVTTEKAAKIAANRWVDELEAQQERAIEAVAARRQEEAERRAEEEARAERESAIKLVDYVASYVDGLERNDIVEPSTIMGYRKEVKTISNTLPNMPLDEFTMEQATEWQTQLSQRYAFSTVKKIRNLLRAALQQAVECGLIDRNPVLVVRRTRHERISDRTKAKDNYLDKENRTILLDELDRMEDTPVTTAARLALYAGLRRGEVCALAWRDIDFSEQTIRVSHAIGNSEGGVYMKRQKNDAEDRLIPMHPELVSALVRWRRAQKEQAFLVGAGIDYTFVVGDPTKEIKATYYRDRDPEKPDGILNPTSLLRQWQAIAQASRARGVLGKKPTFHNLRHTFASYLANEGDVPIEELAKLMGHANTNTTKRYYVAKDEKAQLAKSRKALEKAFSGDVVRKSERRGEVIGYPSATGTDGR